MAKQKSNLIEFDIWVVQCLLCDQDLATEEGNRPPYGVQREHMATHGVDYRTCEPTKDGYHVEEQTLEGGGSLTISQSVYAENHGKGREVVRASRSYGAMSPEAALTINTLEEGEPSYDDLGAPEKPSPGATQSEKAQEAPQDPDEYNPTGLPPNGLPEPSQRLLEATVDPHEPMPEQILGMTPVNLVCGGPGGPYGGYSIYAPDYKLGTTYADPDDHYEKVGGLLDIIEERFGIECVAGTVVYTQREKAHEMISDDERVAVLPKEKPKRKSARPHYAEVWND